MSPLWRDEIGAFIGPRKVVLTRMSRGLRPQCVAEWRSTLKQPDLNDWSVAVAALDTELAKGEWQNANLRVAISDQWARYRIVPWSAELRSEAERLNHARLIMTNTYGSLIDNWTLSASESFPGAARIVSALPTALIEELRSRFPAHQLRLISMQPQLIVAYNAWRHRLPVSGGWFVTIEEGSLAAIHWSDQGWDRVYSVRISDSWDAELRRLQTFGRLAESRPAEGPIFIDAPLGLRIPAAGADTGLVWLRDWQLAATTLDHVARLRAGYA